MAVSRIEYSTGRFADCFLVAARAIRAYFYAQPRTHPRAETSWRKWAPRSS